MSDPQNMFVLHHGVLRYNLRHKLCIHRPHGIWRNDLHIWRFNESLCMQLMTFRSCFQMTEEEEQLQQARLEIRRGLPLQDLSGKRGFADS